MPKQQLCCTTFFISAGIFLLGLAIFLSTLAAETQENLVAILIGITISFLSGIIIIVILTIIIIDIVLVEYVAEWVIEGNTKKDLDKKKS